MNSAGIKKILFICRHAQYGTSLAKDALDAILATSAYGQDISVLFMDDGVFQLLDMQKTHAIAQKSFSSMLLALDYYEISKIFVQAESLHARDIKKNECIIANIQLLSNSEVRELLSEQDHLMSF
jgi:tRNA 2-thiouridine synthesizing protein C